jgi:membrane protein DedA with SNARE-associated domain
MLQHLLESYGLYAYLAVFVGTFLEGETILLMAGFAAHRGYLLLPWVMLLAFAGSYAGDQLWFWVGRRHGAGFLRRFPSWAPRVDRARHLLERYHAGLILGFRFIYGIRTVTPFALGMTRVGSLRFLVLNGVGAAIWSVAVAGGGYLFGEALESLVHRAKHLELVVLVAIGVAGLLLWGIRTWRERHRGS